MTDDDADLRPLLDARPTHPRRPPPRSDRRQADREAVTSQLPRYRDERGDDWADIIDLLTMHPEQRRRVVQLLGELEAN
jgi:hypothetical protein